MCFALVILRLFTVIACVSAPVRIFSNHIKSPRMKRFLPLTVLAFLAVCNTEREIQADVMNANLVKIDVVTRYPNLKQKMLTWRAADNVLYVTFEPMSTDLLVGASRSVMMRK
jgi:hypothetical protein